MLMAKAAEQGRNTQAIFHVHLSSMGESDVTQVEVHRLPHFVSQSMIHNYPSLPSNPIIFLHGKGSLSL